MAGSKYQEDRVVEGGGREAVALGKAHANTVENDSSYRRPHSCSVSRTLRIFAVSFSNDFSLDSSDMYVIMTVIL